MASDIRLLSSILGLPVTGSVRPFLLARTVPDYLSRNGATFARSFSGSTVGRRRRDLADLPPKSLATFTESASNELLSLKWNRPPRNILLVKKRRSQIAAEGLVEFATHIKSSYPSINILLEPAAELEFQSILPFDVYTPNRDSSPHVAYRDKVDMIATFGGDGTILHAASLFAASDSVPPMLSFSMGTLGFLGEWKFAEYKRAFREVYMSGAELERRANLETSPITDNDAILGPTGWSSIRGKSLGPSRSARVLLRQRLKVGVFDANGNRLSSNGSKTATHDVHVMNEVSLHRGRDPHLAIVKVFVGGRFLTEAVADGMIVSTPTGSTAYSLSSGGSIIHPLVSSLLLTPICARSLSFRPLVLPAATPIKLQLSEKNRGREVELSIDGVRRSHGIGVGTEVRVSGEELIEQAGAWTGGIPCIMRRGAGGADGDDGWVGGLNSLLKFNYPFGEGN